MARELLKGGAVRLQAGSCAYVYRRLRPGAMLLTIRGDDDGQLGAAVWDELRGEQERFRTDLTLFIDARASGPPSERVRDAWTAWLEHRRRTLRRVSVLASPGVVQLTVSIARHLSGTSGLLHIHETAAAFEQEVAAVARTWPPPPVAEDPVSVERTTLVDGTRRLAAGGMAFTFTAVNPTTLLLRGSGRDEGDLVSDALDEIATVLRREKRLALYVDATEVQSVSPGARRDWTAFLGAWRPELARTAVLVGSRVLQLTMDIARHEPGLGQALSVYGDRAAFADALRQDCPAFPGL